MAEEREPPMTAKGGDFDKDLIRELAELLDETGLTEIEIEIEGRRVRVARGAKVAASFAPDSGHAAPSPPREGGARGRKSEDASHPGTVPSPMVGTAYRSSEPGVPPFIEVGTKVTAGQTLLIIEAMKTMNQIPSPHAGTVLAILFDDGEPVEYGEPLVIVERG
ncbi:MAG: acetyl-CoA carboxylase, biotin carboxyl carrier protein [Methyloceanibacter sp.]|jgi:acetyl-CoA carboxylase biotin carboxyl carrier protein|nr:acetyl-CoA carboxylase, biotin carboxyl carrier protein [Methyloceanibacter sp.]